MTIDNVIRARETLETALRVREHLADDFGRDEDFLLAEQLRSQVQALRWAERICRAALVVNEERTPDGVSETLIDELCKAARS